MNSTYVIKPFAEFMKRQGRKIVLVSLRILPLALMFVALVLRPCVSYAETQSFEFTAFDRVAVSEGIHMFVDTDEAFTVTAESEDMKQLERLVLDVRHGTLRARMDKTLLSFTRPKGWKITVRVSMPTLNQAQASSGAELVIDEMSGTATELSASGGSDLRVTNLTGKLVSAKTSGGARLAVEGGTCEILTANASTGASVSLSSLECMSVEVDASTGANADVFASELIDADASSGGAIRVFGAHKEIKINSSSGGSISFP